MKKIFRMQYEACNGDCYCPEQEFFKIMKTLQNDPIRVQNLMENLIQAHENLCGNVNVSYAVDQDTHSGVYVGSFYHYGKLELFSDLDPLLLIEIMLKAINDHWETAEGQAELDSDPGLGHSVCEYGEDQALRKFILDSAELDYKSFMV